MSLKDQLSGRGYAYWGRTHGIIRLSPTTLAISGLTKANDPDSYKDLFKELSGSGLWLLGVLGNYQLDALPGFKKAGFKEIWTGNGAHGDKISMIFKRIVGPLEGRRDKVGGGTGCCSWRHDTTLGGYPDPIYTRDFQGKKSDIPEGWVQIAVRGAGVQGQRLLILPGKGEVIAN